MKSQDLSPVVHGVQTHCKKKNKKKQKNPAPL